MAAVTKIGRAATAACGRFIIASLDTSLSRAVSFTVHLFQLHFSLSQYIMAAANSGDGYDPKKSKVSNDTMEKFRLSNVTGKLIEVPGIGDAAILKLASDPDPTERITNTHQLVGKYLMLKGPDENGESVSVFQTNQKFWYWLKMRGIVVHRSAIVLAISTKVASFFPEFADPHADLDLDDDEE